MERKYVAQMNDSMCLLVPLKYSFHPAEVVFVGLYRVLAPGRSSGVSPAHYPCRGQAEEVLDCISGLVQLQPNRQVQFDHRMVLSAQKSNNHKTRKW